MKMIYATSEVSIQERHDSIVVLSMSVNSECTLNVVEVSETSLELEMISKIP